MTTTVVEVAPDADHPVVSVLGVIHELLDSVGRVGSGPMAEGDHARVVGECDRAIRRLEAVKLGLVAAADAASVASLSGMTGTAA